MLTGLSELGALMQFHRGGTLDAQAQGATAAYANYAYGSFFAGLGWSLQTTLMAADAYAFGFSSYPSGTKMDPTYGSIPATNAQNIAAGWNGANAGALCTSSN